MNRHTYDSAGNIPICLYDTPMKYSRKPPIYARMFLRLV